MFSKSASKQVLVILVMLAVLLQTLGVTPTFAAAPQPPDLVSPGPDVTASSNPPTLCAHSGEAGVSIRFETWGGGEPDHVSSWIPVDGGGNACWTDSIAWSAGNHIWQARAINTSGEQSGASPTRGINIPEPPPPPIPAPICSIDKLGVDPPPPQLVGIVVTVSASASCTNGVSSLRFFVESSPLGTTNGPSGDVTWNTSGWSRGDYTLRVDAADSVAGYIRSASETYRLDTALSQAPPPTTVPNPVEYFKTGNVIQIGPDVFVIIDGARRLVPNSETLDALGIPRTLIDNRGLSENLLKQISWGSDIPDAIRDPSGFATFKATFFPKTTPPVPQATLNTQSSGSTSGNAPWVAANSAAVTAGRSFSASWGGLAVTGSDWITIHPVGTSDTQYLGWDYVRASSGTITLVAPSRPGRYDLQLYRKWVKIAASNTFAVVAEPTPKPATRVQESTKQAQPTEAPTQTAKPRIETCFRAKGFGSREGHHFAWFKVDTNLSGWFVKSAWWTPRAQLWAYPDGDGYTEAGFPWPDWFPVILPLGAYYLCGFSK